MIAEHGVAAVTIDQLAGRLVATRGSSYWHRRSREELVTAAVRLWARQSTTDRLPRLKVIQDRVKSLRALLQSGYQEPSAARS